MKTGLSLVRLIAVFRMACAPALYAAEHPDADAHDLFKALKARGVRFEVCAVAMCVFKADPARLIPEVKLVANVFNSMIGYQTKAYALIAIN